MDENTNGLSLADYYTAIKAEHEANNAWSAEQAQKAMDYQTQMSNTAHVREVADLKAAGLNPVLSAGGQGATTGSGITAQRGDENVQALYGLVKESMKAMMTQANAMQNTAKYISGVAGSSSPLKLHDSSKASSTETVLKEKNGVSKEDKNTATNVVAELTGSKKSTAGALVDLAIKLGTVVSQRVEVSKSDQYQKMVKGPASSQYGAMNIWPGIEKLQQIVSAKEAAKYKNHRK